MIHIPFFSQIVIVSMMLVAALASPATAFDWIEAASLTGYAAVESRFFMQNAALPDQESGPQLSLVVQPEASLESTEGRHQFKLTPFAGIDGMDDERTHVDLREAYWRYRTDAWEVLTGVNKVFWGVTESQHLVDIINQTDTLEDVDQEDKLGQPMIMAATLQDWGEWQFFLLPYFRERRYPGKNGRLRPPLPVDDDSQFESDAKENHMDAALRYSHYFGDWDVGAYYFYGTSREPKLLPNEQMDRLTPYYELIQQVGTDLQYTRNAWLWKFEGIVRDSREESFAAAVGGFEFTFYQILQSNADLGLLLEYNWDGRDNTKSPPTFYDNDLFAGIRLAANDPQDTSVLMGAVVDVGTGSTYASLEAERRLGDAFVVEAQARLLLGIDDQDPSESFATDDFVNISLQYHF